MPPIVFDRPTINYDEIFMWLMPDMNYFYKLDIIHGSTTTTVDNGHIINGEFERIGTYGVGEFDIILLNADGRYNNIVANFDTINLYIDVSNSSPTTKRYSGIVRIIQTKYGSYGAYMRIRGQYVSYEMLSIYVTKSYTTQTGSSIIKNLISTYLPTFTTTNVQSTTSLLTIEWKKVPLLDCIKEVCIGTSCDFYVDPNKGVHYFAVNSILNEREAAVYGQNIYKSDSFGVGDDSIDRKTKIKLIGGEISGLPIIHENIEVSDSNLQTIIKDNSITNLVQAREKVTYEYNNMYESKFKGSLICFGLLTLNPGEKMWVSLPEQGIHKVYKVIAYKHIIKNGIFMTIPTFVEIQKSLYRNITDMTIKDNRTTNDKNPNDMKFSRFFEFSNSTDTLSITNLDITNGKLSITSGQTSGIFISTSATTEDENDITQIEMRVVGSQLSTSLFYIRYDDGNSFEDVIPSFDTYTGTVITPTNTGNRVSIKVQLTTSSANTNPEIDTIALYYR